MCVIRKANMHLIDGQHREWFIASLLPRLRISLSQHKIGTQVESLEIAMILHAMPMSNATLGVQKIHSQLQSLRLEFQNLKKDKEAKPEVRAKVQCLKCKSQGHGKEHCPVFVKFITRGGPTPLRLEAPAGPSVGATLWCTIFQVARKDATDNCHLLQNFIQTQQQLFYDFCKFVGHDERYCHSSELIMERTPMYHMQVETRLPGQGVEGARGDYQGRGWGRRGGGPGRGREEVIFYNCGTLGHYTQEFQNQTWSSSQYCNQFEHTIEECPILIAKMQERKTQPEKLTKKLKMMIVDPCEEDKNVNIMLRRRIMTGDDNGKQLEEDRWVRKA